MKKSTFTLNILWMTTILLCTASIQGMESNVSWPRWAFNKLSYLSSIIWTPKQLSPEDYAQLALQAKEYNQHNPLLSLPDVLSHIFSHCLVHNENQVESLKNSMKSLIKLNSTCKNLHTLLTRETIGKFCKNYAQNDKDQALFNLGESINNLTYMRKRLPALILICAGADPNTSVWTSCLLTKAVEWHDAGMTATLFRHHADPNVHEGSCPLLFFIRAKEVAQLFINNGVDLNATPKYSSINVLWEIIRSQDYPAELITLYLKHGANPRNLNSIDNSCLLHGLANSDHIGDVNNFFKKVTLLLDTIPDMINALNKSGQTPLDVAQVSLEGSTTPEAFEQLIALFKEHGGLTTQKLKEQDTLKQMDQ